MKNKLTRREANTLFDANTMIILGMSERPVEIVVSNDFMQNYKANFMLPYDLCNTDGKLLTRWFGVPMREERDVEGHVTLRYER